VKTYPDAITKNRPYKWFNRTIPMSKVPYTNSYYINPTDVAAEALRGNDIALFVFTVEHGRGRLISP